MARAAPPLATASLAVLGLWTGLALAAPTVAPYPPLGQDLAHRLASPDSGHWLGTDALGRDILSRLIFGARISLPVGLAAVALAAVLGTAVGSVAGFGGWLADEALMRATDLMLSFPTVILALVITAALGAGIRNAVLAIMVAWWPTYARMVRALVLAAREREFVQGARGLGASSWRILLRHVLPEVTPSIVVMGTLDVGLAVLTFASLSFLGLGAPPEVPEWGSMIAAGRSHLDQWWIGLFPGLAILSVTLAFNIVGDGLRDQLDPRLRAR